MRHEAGGSERGESLLRRQVGFPKGAARGIGGDQHAEILAAPQQRREHRGPRAEALQNLDEAVVPLGAEAGFRCEAILINTQKFTKTSNIWGIGNNERGTNSNRIVMLQKPA
jgi:hypothetical protein